LPSSKKCARCGNEYPTTYEYFYKHIRAKDGLLSRCRQCEQKRIHVYYLANRDSLCEKQRERQRNKPPEQRRRALQAWRENNREIFNKKQRIRRNSTPELKLNTAVGHSIYKSLCGNKHGRHWENLVGYTLDDLMAHLESQFSKGMTWDNYGAWHIDHIRPVSDFNFSTSDDPEFRVCWSLWNLQPLWAIENFMKQDKCETPPLPLVNGEMK
jgi:DNA-directed RNA polymerase subunit RPC12/RpoP